MQINATVRHTPNRMAVIRKSDHASIGKEVKELSLSNPVMGTYNDPTLTKIRVCRNL